MLAGILSSPKSTLNKIKRKLCSSSIALLDRLERKFLLHTFNHFTQQRWSVVVKEGLPVPIQVGVRQSHTLK